MEWMSRQTKSSKISFKWLVLISVPVEYNKSDSRENGLNYYATLEDWNTKTNLHVVIALAQCDCRDKY